MRGMIPLLVVFVGVMVVTTPAAAKSSSSPPPTTTPPTVTSSITSGTSSTPTTPGEIERKPNNTASAVTSSTFGTVLSFVGVASVRQVL